MSITSLDRTRLVLRAGLLLTLSCGTAAAQPQNASELASGPLTEAAVVRAALATSPRIDVAHHRWQAAMAIPAGIRSLPDPVVRLGLYAIPLGSFDPLDGQVRLQVQQEFPHPGTLDRRAEVAELEATRVATAVPGTRASVAAAARRAYQDLWYAERALVIHHGHLGLVRDLSDSTEELYAAGISPQENVFRAMQEMTTLLTEVARLEGDAATARVALNAVLHRSPAAPLGPVVDRPDLDRLAGIRLEELLAAAERLNPELAASGAAVARDAARIDSERHEAKADFGVMAEWWTASDGMGGRFERYSLLGTLTLPWVHDAKYVAAVDAAISARDAAEADRLATRDRVLERVASAWERARALERIVELYRTTLLPQSEQSLAAARAAYESAQTQFVTVIDNERTLLLNRLGLARLEADHGLAVADLLEAIGVTGWEQVWTASPAAGSTRNTHPQPVEITGGRS